MIPSRPLLLDSAALTKLKRPMLQQVAIKEHIKANAKSAEIIRLLLQKHPDGVPGSQTAEHLSRITQRIIKPESNAIRASERQSKKRRVGPELGTCTPNRPTNSATRPPGNKDVRFVKRQLTSLVDDGIAIREEVEETEMVLGRVMSVANEVSSDIREISWIRHKIESHVLHELKYDRTLWDGTRVMADPKARKKWEDFLENMRAEELASYQQTIRELDEVLQEHANRASSHSANQSDSGSESSQPSQKSSQRRKRTFDESDLQGS